MNSTLTHPAESTRFNHNDADVDIETRVVCNHYRETIDNYRCWSPEGNLHFGYWRWGLNPFRRRDMLEEMNRLVFQHLRLEQLESGIVADLGCGVGAVTRMGSKLFPQLSWHGVNISSRQIAEAEAALDTNDSEDAVQFHCLDYHRLPWSDNSLQGALMMESFCYSRRPGQLLSEVARVICPGARIAITDGFLTRPIDETSWFFRKSIQGVTRGWAVPAYHSMDQLDSWLEETGLKLVVKQELGWRLAPTAFHSIPLTIWCIFRLLLRGDRNPWRWRHLLASGLSLAVGLHRRNFRYCLCVFEK